MGGGIRTHDIQNHNLAHYQLCYAHREGLFNLIKVLRVVANFAAPSAYSPARFHRSSTRRFTSSDMAITPGQGRVKPSSGHLRVASMPTLEP